jgi:signal transduction histidine kinase/phage shock protein PspC (stress-responsive transcriptional regulator)
MPTTVARPRLTRDTEHAIVAGVLAGLARRLGVDPILVRIGFVILAFGTAGAALLVYVIAWPFIPADEDVGKPPTRTERWLEGVSSPRRLRLAAGVGLLTLAALLVFRELGIWWSDAVIWPLVLAASGAALLWAQSRAMQPGPSVDAASIAPPSSAATAEASAAATPRPKRAGAADLYRGGFGVALVIGAGLLFLSANDALGGAREVVLVAIAATAALALILAPFLWRLGRNLAAERAERIRSQERAELAAHVHDSVLQTLTLMQKRADDPREIASLARRQERELRSWLFDDRSRRSGSSLAGALEDAAAKVEDAHGVPIEVVAVGDLELDERAAALVAATREALTNAAKFAGEAGPVAVYAEMENGRAQVFVRDRGNGFDLDAVPADRRGLRESIVGRMERHGGTAVVRSSPGSGTEVELTLESEER